MVPIGYAHIYAGLPMYVHDLELIEDLVALGAKVAAPSTINIANADIENWRGRQGAERIWCAAAGPAPRRRIAQDGQLLHLCLHALLGGALASWNMHTTSLESTGHDLRQFGWWARAAAATASSPSMPPSRAANPKFGYHLDGGCAPGHASGRRSTSISIAPATISCLGFYVGLVVGNGVPVFTGFRRRPRLDELDALGERRWRPRAGWRCSSCPGSCPPFATAEQAFGGVLPRNPSAVGPAEVNSIYERFCTGSSADFLTLVHLGCPHASFQEMKEYGELLGGKRVKAGVELWRRHQPGRPTRWRPMPGSSGRAGDGAGPKVISEHLPHRDAISRPHGLAPTRRWASCRRPSARSWSIPPSRRNMSAT